MFFFLFANLDRYSNNNKRSLQIKMLWSKKPYDVKRRNKKWDINVYRLALIMPFLCKLKNYVRGRRIVYDTTADLVVRCQQWDSIRTASVKNDNRFSC